jgi:hypothetical protein
MGIARDGRKTILGFGKAPPRMGRVVGELFGDLMEWGLDFTVPRLYVLDGGKALQAAVKKYAGEATTNVRSRPFFPPPAAAYLFVSRHLEPVQAVPFFLAHRDSFLMHTSQRVKRNFLLCSSRIFSLCLDKPACRS